MILYCSYSYDLTHSLQYNMTPVESGIYGPSSQSNGTSFYYFFIDIVCIHFDLILSGCPLSFETGGTMGYNCCFFLNFVPLHIESPYNFGGTGPILEVKKTSAEGKWACCSLF